MTEGQEFKSNEGVVWTVIKFISSTEVYVRSANGTVKWTTSANLRRGQLRCRYYPSVFGVGFLGQGPHKASRHAPEKNRYVATRSYQSWKGVLERGYSEKYHIKRPTYVGCTVCPEWHNFQNFADWYVANYFDDCQVDKDILVFGNKVYSPETCLMVSTQVNNFITDCAAARGECVLGVRQLKGRYKAAVSDKSERVHLGTYDTEQAAFEAYAHEKYAVAQRLICTEEMRVKIQNYLLAKFNEIRTEKGWM